MGISASCNLDDGILKHSLPRTPVVAENDDANASLSMPNFAEDESASDPNEHRPSVWAAVHSKLPTTGSRFSGIKPTGSVGIRMISSLSAEERRDLEDLQKGVLMEDMSYPILSGNVTRSNISQPISSVPGSASSGSLAGGSSVGTKSPHITNVDCNQSSTCLSKNLSSVGRKLSCSSDDLNDFNAARFREVNP